MNVAVLIDSLVRQTTVLIAQLATVDGGRPSLAHTANQVFVELVRELKSQGVANKVLADMFGLALRTYHLKLQRLAESNTFRGRSLWEAVFDHIQQHGSLLQSDIVQKFKADDYATVKGVLNDLVESGLVFRTGQSSRAVYRTATAEEVALPGRDQNDSTAAMVWVAVNRIGPATKAQLGGLVALDEADLNAALEQLVADGRVTAHDDGRTRTYRCDGCFIGANDASGWEAAVFDHYQAVVTAISTKLRLRDKEGGEHTGGSTINFWIWPGHPLEDDVLNLLRQFREMAMTLRRRVAEVNEASERSEESMTRVIAYVGQAVLRPEPDVVEN